MLLTFTNEQPEVLLCFVSIVRGAAKLQVLDRRGAARCERHDVMEFEEAGLLIAKRTLEQYTPGMD